MKSYAVRPDRLDLDHLKELVESPGYALIAAKLRLMLEDARNKLEHERDDVRGLQERIATIRRVMDLPGILDHEIRAKSKTRTD